MRGERVAVRAGPRRVRAGIRIRRDRLRQLFDDGFGDRAANIAHERRRRAIPFGIGCAEVRDRDGGTAAQHVPSDHFVARIAVRARGLGREPCVHRKRAAPIERAAGVDLHDGFRMSCGIRREPGRALRGGAPLAVQRRGSERQRHQRPRCQQGDERKQPQRRAEDRHCGHDGTPAMRLAQHIGRLAPADWYPFDLHQRGISCS